MKSILQGGTVEVDEGTETEGSSLQIRQDLRTMYLKDGLDCFELDNELILDEEIELRFSDCAFLVDSVDLVLRLKSNPSRLKLDLQAS